MRVQTTMKAMIKFPILNFKMNEEMILAFKQPLSSSLWADITEMNLLRLHHPSQ